MGMADTLNARTMHPIDLIEQMAFRHEWPAERVGEDEMNLVIAGSWTDYHMSIHWRPDLETLHVACAFDFKVPDYRQNDVYKLLAQINEQLWIGHFDLWASDGLIMFRHGHIASDSLVTTAQCEAMLKAALEACERYYQAFQFVVWAGKAPREALVSTMFETDGQA